MTRLIQFATASVLTLAVTGVTSAAISACGGRPGSPGELPPMAPRPGPADPTALPIRGVLAPATPSGITAPASGPIDAGQPGPVSAVSPARVVPRPVFAPVVGEALDAGTSDGYSPPLPPLPDGGGPADSRMEPRN
jgi:hypothetical protein